MKYYLSLGWSGAAIVETPREDLDAMIAEAVRMGIGESISFEDMLKEYEEALDDEDSWAESCSDVYEYAEGSEWGYNQNLDAFVFIQGLYWEPVPPNTMVGPVKDGETPSRMRFQRRMRSRI